MPQKRRDWDRIIEELNVSSSGRRTIRMGSPGSAQVTRCRLVAQWAGLEIHTNGSLINLRLSS